MMLSSDDMVQIQQLYARYNHAIDSGKGDEWAACFTPDGAFTARGTGDPKGTEQLANFARGFATQMKARHWTNNLVVEGALGGATGTCYLLLYRVADDRKEPPSLVTSAIYSDTLAKDAGAWRFSSRTVTPDA
ncbi:MAG: nuclear transport factor 2 family protein [Tepidiformaceae bacterium]